MPNITYLIGAGASANALPLIKKNTNNNICGLSQELNTFVQELVVFNSKFSSDEKMLLAEVTNKCIEFGTPDLYAKFLLETKDYQKYKVVKNLIIVYFTYKQNQKNAFDYRALTFLTTIAQDNRVPENIKVLSWNYDRQIEIAANKLKPFNSVENDIIKGFTCWPNCEEGQDGNRYEGVPFLLHLNGVAGYNYCKRNFAEQIAETDTQAILNLNSEKLLSFAWETDPEDGKRTFIENRLSIAKKIAENTEVLVIIGYSFPFFNRKIDNEIFKSMKKLKKIYFQDPYNNGSYLKQRFDISLDIDHVLQTENYHIPFEL